ncbi:glutamine-hydrolyzing carbamoyl-phosphate synthase small subunit [Marivirga sp. S37H4]|uniref:Carbamoyl phosphate synthase small chain n=1 Tax=Marivirga aurantiaca TaxID=2802615 RepID=A0A934X2T9_9BACT|nr:glutamine-hydrolyzing carbamoyl-phosphate synthase small subunit [Marivirga aurantiaca]MBK6267241.1 glutamine-hydrolyzing carbamoyl-phosphate synthase small subunit [Marivirga aurantiaca]
MKYINKTDAVLLLEDGTVFRGKSIGFHGTRGGEICFNTGMTGYQEVYTDPSYYGQIMVNTNAHIGNYGTMIDETESGSPKIFGVVINSFSENFSRFTADGSLQSYLEQHQIPGICDVDTRSIVRHIRDKGTMNCIISSEIHDISELQKHLDEVPSMEGLELSSKVSVTEPYEIGEPGGIKLVVMDYGIKTSILNQLAGRGFHCKVYPAKTKFEETEKWEPNAYFLSNGPGDPAVMDYAIETAKQIIDSDKPLFGICLGHQLIAKANGIGTYKMHNGHRGLNQPVKNLLTGKGEITSQNHGFSVVSEDVDKSELVEITHINLNDNTVEGLKMRNKKVFSVQYHPESSPGPHDSRYLFDQFISLIN